MARKGFSEIFQENPDGSLSPIHQIDVNGLIFGPDVIFGPGATFGGVNFHSYKGFDMEVEEKNGVWVLKGIYKRI